VLATLALLASCLIAASVGATTPTNTMVDSFSRTLGLGWGAADVGGAYKTVPATGLSTDGSRGLMVIPDGQERVATMPSVSSGNSDVSLSLAVPRIPTAGNGLFFGVLMQHGSAGSYEARIRVHPSSAAYLSILYVAASGSTTTLASEVAASFSVANGSKINLRIQDEGLVNSSLRLRAWASGTAEPTTWQRSATGTQLRAAGDFGIRGYVSASSQTTTALVDDVRIAPFTAPVAPTPTPTATTTPTASPSPVSSAGARLPINYALTALHGKLRYVSPTGSDGATGTLAAPYATVAKAEAVSVAGDSIVLRGGTYPTSKQPMVTVNINNLTIIAYPGETPVFDGSIAAPASATTEGSLRYFTYRPIPAYLGEGLSFANLPKATFSGTRPTGLAASRGWRCVSGSSYTTPGAPSSSDPSGCGSTKSYVLTGYYPDQVWVNGRQLTQVHDKAKVVSGFFWVNRALSSDTAPAATNLFLSATDAADMSKVRVSGSTGTLFTVLGDGFHLEGARIVNHSNAMNASPLVANSGVDSLVVRDVAISSSAGIAIKLGGGSASGGGSLIRSATLDHVAAIGSGWSGSVVGYTNDTKITDSVFSDSNPFGEFAGAPQLGGIKATKNDRMKVINSQFKNNNGPGVWWDQSNYDVTLAGSTLSGNTETPVFFEISHGLTMVNNTLLHAGAGAAFRAGGSSGLKLVNNTIVGGADSISVLTDARSKTFNSGRPCSEHTVRYGQGGNLADCNIGHSTDLDSARSGAYGGVNNTPGMNWMPKIDLLVDNVLANPTASGNCGSLTNVCISAYMSWNGMSSAVAPNSIISPSAELNGNVYQGTGKVFKVLATSGQVGGFSAGSLSELAGSAGFGSSVYGKSVEKNGQYATSGLVDPDGTQSSTLAAKNGSAAPTPTDAAVNAFVPAGTRHYGALGN